MHSIIEKKPTVSLPSALEVLKTRVGDCNEHTALYVAMARALGIPARIAVGLVYLRGAFYYHAWAEVWLEEGRGRALASGGPDAEPVPRRRHPRAPRPGRPRQAGRASWACVGQARLSVLEVELQPGSTPVLVGRPTADLRPLDLSFPQRDGRGRTCWSSPGR